MSATKPWSHPLGKAVSNVNFLAQELITLIAKDKGILHQSFMWLQELIRKTQPRLSFNNNNNHNVYFLPVPFTH